MYPRSRKYQTLEFRVLCEVEYKENLRFYFKARDLLYTVNFGLWRSGRWGELETMVKVASLKHWDVSWAAELDTGKIVNRMSIFWGK